MLIRVKYRDNTYDMLKAWRLGEFIDSGKIEAFFREGKWVSVDSEQIRHAPSRDYGGPERRRRENNLHRTA